MSEKSRETRKPVLDPIERASEVLFGLIMVLSFTGSLSAATAGHSEVRTMLFGALGCNFAWGIVDAIMYLMNTVSGRARNYAMARHARAAKPEKAYELIREALPPAIAAGLSAAELEVIRGRLLAIPHVPRYPRVHRDDLIGALGVFLLVVLSTLPVVVPFTFMHDAMRALRWSNLVAITMLFMTGWSLGRYTWQRPWIVGLVMVAIGLVLVGITIILGG
jgi:VIT1/CCC1 family predicted Fe2+/Mn2+ transporter